MNDIRSPVDILESQAIPAPPYRGPPIPMVPLPSPGINRHAPKTFPPFSFHVLGLLAPASIFGLLARLGLSSLMTFQGASVFPLAWVQALGCLVMGLAFGLREPITKFYPPLYTAITTGFCGSLTTFSSWNLDVFLAFSNPQGFHRGRLRDIIDGMGQICATLGISIGCLALGMHLASNIDRRVSLKSPPTHPYLRHSVACLSFLSYGLVIILYFILPHHFRPDAMAALLFCYPGALSRHVMGTLLNPFLANFPLGTFGSNIGATILEGIFHTLQRNPSFSNSITTCALLQGLQDGYCGCLSTVSTFAVEIRALRHRAWIYIFASLMAAQFALVLTVGIPWWSGSVNERLICHMRLEVPGQE